VGAGVPKPPAYALNISEDSDNNFYTQRSFSSDAKPPSLDFRFGKGSPTPHPPSPSSSSSFEAIKVPLFWKEGYQYDGLHCMKDEKQKSRKDIRGGP